MIIELVSDLAAVIQSTFINYVACLVVDMIHCTNVSATREAPTRKTLLWKESDLSSTRESEYIDRAIRYAHAVRSSSLYHTHTRECTKREWYIVFSTDIGLRLVAKVV